MKDMIESKGIVKSRNGRYPSNTFTEIKSMLLIYFNNMDNEYGNNSSKYIEERFSTNNKYLAKLMCNKERIFSGHPQIAPKDSERFL